MSEVSQELVHQVCQYLREGMLGYDRRDLACNGCELTVETAYGSGTPGCVLRAQQLIKLVRGTPAECDELTQASELDRAYISGANQAAAMAHQSLRAMDKWIADGCGNRGPKIKICARGGCHILVKDNQSFCAMHRGDHW